MSASPERLTCLVGQQRENGARPASLKSDPVRVAWSLRWASGCAPCTDTPMTCGHSFSPKSGFGVAMWVLALLVLAPGVDAQTPPTGTPTRRPAEESETDGQAAPLSPEPSAPPTAEPPAPTPPALPDAAATSKQTPAAGGEPGDAPEPPEIETWGYFDPGKGFLIGRQKLGEVSLSVYGLLRYMNQVDHDGVFTDHLGNERPVDQRNDFFSHRIIVYLNGWVGLPKLRYTVFLWTVNTTDQRAIFMNLGYQFARWFNLYGGIAGNPGTRSLLGSHPYWLGHDRVMADEFFRPFFTQGIWANGEVLPGLWYNVMVGNSSSALGVTAVQLDRKFTYGGSVWWMPTTQEFGPRGAFGDWEMHPDLATRVGASTTISPEQRYTEDPLEPPQNTTLKLADSVNVFSLGALAPGVTVGEVDYRIFAIDLGAKYRGFFLQTELYYRWLGGFRADGLLPVDSIVDKGFYVQAAFFPWPKRLELYAATSQIFGDKDAGFGNSSEYLVGTNLYPADTRNIRLNLQLMDINRSPVGSTFGYYSGGLDGYTIAVGASVFY